MSEHLRLNHLKETIIENSEKWISQFIRFSNGDSDLRRSLLYVFWMSQDIPKIVQSINENDMDQQFITDLIYYGFGRQISMNLDAQEAMLNATKGLSSKKSLQLLNESPIIDIDSGFALALVIQLSSMDFSDFISSEKNRDFLRFIFENLEDSEIKLLFQRSIQFYYNFVSLVRDREEFSDIMLKFQDDLALFHSITEIIKQIQSELEIRMNQPDQAAEFRNFRLNLIWNALKQSSHKKLLLQIIAKEGIIKEETELKILEYFTVHSDFLAKKLHLSRNDPF
ncbi:MAG TPA: hypothetical protein PK683_20685, partial [Leptospiraceae bacterium]|nr:hypothetical protein [Leptospiraceae bacterium]